MLNVKNLYKSFADQTIINGVTFSLHDGDIAGLVGPSGVGKSVLLKLLAKVIEPDSGEIEHTAEVIKQKADNMISQAAEQYSVGFLFQESALFDSMSVLDNTVFPLVSSKDGNKKISISEAQDRAYKMLAEVGLARAINKLPGELSGGMRRRAGIARALVNLPELVLLDDPTGGLDPVAASVIMDLIDKLHDMYNPTIVIVSHDIRRLLPHVSRVLGLFQGKISCDLAPEKLVEEAPDYVLKFLATRYDFGKVSNVEVSE